MVLLMNELEFKPSDLVEVPIGDLTTASMNWSVAQAVAEPIAVSIWTHDDKSELQVYISSLNRTDHMGEPLIWSPIKHYDQIGPIQFALGLSLMTEDGANWRAWHFSVPDIDHVAADPSLALCLAAIARRFGHTVSVPRQLQYPQQFLQELKLEESRVEAESQLDVIEDAQYGIGESLARYG